MIGGCYTFEDLKRLSGLKGKCAVMKWLEANEIRYVATRLGPTTTHEAINAALGIQPAAAQAPDAPYEANDVI